MLKRIGDISLNSQNTEIILPNHKTITGGAKSIDDESTLEEIISNINEKYQGIFTEGERVIVENMYKKCTKDKALKKYAKNNYAEIFEQSIFQEEFKRIAQTCYMESMGAFAKLFENKELYNNVMGQTGIIVYRELRNSIV